MKLNTIDLNKLNTFLAVYHAQSIRDAARVLHLTPAAISMAVTSFEQQIGLNLFARTGRRLLRTENADRLAAQASQSLGNLQSLLMELQSERGEVCGHLRVGAPSEFGVNIVIPLLGEFRQRHPKFRFTLKLGEQSLLLPALIAGQFDLVICDDGPYTTKYPQTSAIPIASETLVLACSTKFYKDNIGKDHSLKNLQDKDHIGYVESQEDLHKWYRHHFKKTPKLNLSLVVDNARGVLAAIRSDLGLGMIPSYMLSKDDMTKIKIITTNHRPMINQMLSMRLKDHLVTTAERTWLNHIQENVTRMQRR